MLNTIKLKCTSSTAIQFKSVDSSNDGTNIVKIEVENPAGGTNHFNYEEDWTHENSTIYKLPNITGFTNNVWIRITNNHYKEIGNFYLNFHRTDTVQGGTRFSFNVVNTILYPKPFITDRTQQDVDMVREYNKKIIHGVYERDYTDEDLYYWYGVTPETISEYHDCYPGLKGALNEYDLRRIEYNMTYISDQLNLDLDTYYNKQNDTFSIPEPLFDYYWEHLKRNLEMVYNTGQHYRTTPRVPDLPYNTYQKINTIEEILYDTHIHAKTDADSMSFCGEIYSGQDIGTF